MFGQRQCVEDLYDELNTVSMLTINRILCMNISGHGVWVREALAIDMKVQKGDRGITVTFLRDGGSSGVCDVWLRSRS